MPEADLAASEVSLVLVNLRLKVVQSVVSAVQLDREALAGGKSIRGVPVIDYELRSPGVEAALHP